MAYEVQEYIPDQIAGLTFYFTKNYVKNSLRLRAIQVSDLCCMNYAPVKIYFIFFSS